MKLSELLQEIKRVEPEDADPEIRVCGVSGGFRNIKEVVPRSEYYDDHPAFSEEFEKGNFVVLEI